MDDVLRLELSAQEAKALALAVEVAIRSGQLLTVLDAVEDDLALATILVKLKSFAGREKKSGA
jgi:nucleotide-binding universal stress UspA family protein